MRSIILYIFLSIYSFNLFASNSDLERLYNESDIVIKGRISSIINGTAEDHGTEYYNVSIQVNEIYNQNIFIDPDSIQVHWQISNLICEEEDLKKCLTKYEKGAWIFFSQRI